MQIKTKLTEVQIQPDAYQINTMGVPVTIPAKDVTISFHSHGEIVRLTVKEFSPLYEHLNMFVAENGRGAEFVFDIAGKPITDHFKSNIKTLKDHVSRLQKSCGNHIENLIDCNERVRILQFEVSNIKSKWWYKLFTYFSAK